MNLMTPAPPSMSGSAADDVKALRDWCAKLHTQLRYTLNMLDDGNIISLSADKITSLTTDKIIGLDELIQSVTTEQTTASE